MIKECQENGYCHSFEPRYDDVEIIDTETRDAGINFWKEDGTAPMIDYKLKKKVYICDICTRCGKKIDRKENETT